MTNNEIYDEKLRGFYTGDHWVKPDTSRDNGIYNGHFVHSGHIHEHVVQHNLTRVYTGKGFEIWHKPATHNWVGRGEPREYEPAMYIVVEKTDETIGQYTRYNTLQVVWATKKHAQVLKALVAKYSGEEVKPADTVVDEAEVEKLKFTFNYLKAQRAALESPETMSFYSVGDQDAIRQEGRFAQLDDMIADIQHKLAKLI